MIRNTTAYPTSATTRTAHLFVQQGRRPRNADEQTVYLRSYFLKAESCAQLTLEVCAKEMARLIGGEECILVPVPDCCGSTIRNLRLAQAVAVYAKGGAEVMDILTRSEKTESQCERHCRGEAALTPAELKIVVRPHKPFTLRKIYFVDNVTTSGATIQACHDAFGFGTGLVYAEALRNRA